MKNRLKKCSVARPPRDPDLGRPRRGDRPGIAVDERLHPGGFPESLRYGDQDQQRDDGNRQRPQEANPARAETDSWRDACGLRDPPRPLVRVDDVLAVLEREMERIALMQPE